LLGVLPDKAQRFRVMHFTERKLTQMTPDAIHTITTRTQKHTIQVIDGYLTIEGEQKMLTPEETRQLLDVLLIWRYGLETIPPDDVED
jgi:hypothetical protein